MANTTPATQALQRLAIAFETHSYDYDPDAAKIGLQAAEALGESASRLLKTLIANMDGKPVCVILPSDREASMKKIAAAFGGKSAGMMPVKDAERITGYRVGGVSPFGQKRRLPTAIDKAALDEPYVFVNGGQRGLQVKLLPADVVKAADAVAVDLSA